MKILDYKKTIKDRRLFKKYFLFDILISINVLDITLIMC